MSEVLVRPSVIDTPLRARLPPWEPGRCRDGLDDPGRLTEFGRLATREQA